MKVKDITLVEVKEFWKHSIHPITGFKVIALRDPRWGTKQRKKNSDPIH